MATSSILKSTKKMIGVDPEDVSFDIDIIGHINTVFSILSQIGVGPKEGYFMIEGDTETWESFIGDLPNIQMVRSYMYLRVRLLFDPPATSFALSAMQDQIDMFEQRLYIEMDNFWRPLATAVDEDSEPMVVPTPIPVDNALLQAHLTDPTPHPVYDDLPDGVYVAKLKNRLA